MPYHVTLRGEAVLSRLAGADRRSIGQANEVAALVEKNPIAFNELITGLWFSDPLVAMRAADAAEKVTRKNPALLQPYKNALLRLAAETLQQELRWHLAVMIPRLKLNDNQRKRAISCLYAYLDDPSSIVRTCALQGFADLARDNPGIRARVAETLREAARAGSPAMKARSRKLLAQLERVD
jgi:hypothetical protein